jgi:hypothetical protein
MSTDDLDIEIACILADCVSDADLLKRIMKHAGLLQRLVCCKVNGQEHAEDRIRTLYTDLADLAVEQIEDSRPFPSGKLH